MAEEALNMEAAEQTEEAPEVSSEAVEQTQPASEEATPAPSAEVPKGPKGRPDSSWRDRREMQEMRDTISNLKGQLEALSRQTPQQAQQAQTLQNILDMDDEELAESFSDGKGIKRVFSQLAQQINRELTEFQKKEIENIRQQEQREARESREKETFNKFVKDNPDFVELYDSGEIVRYLDENPGETYKSAYRALTEEKRISDAVKKALAEQEKNLRAKQNLKTVSTTAPAATPSGDDELAKMLKDSKAHGGVKNITLKYLEKLGFGGD